jgi:hypothetical protein
VCVVPVVSMSKKEANPARAPLACGGHFDAIEVSLVAWNFRVIRAFTRRFRIIPGVGRMRTVVVRVADGDLSGDLAMMGEWLARHGCDPARFVYDQADGALVISIEFPNDWQAEAFAIRFDGQAPTTDGELLAALSAPPPA